MTETSDCFFVITGGPGAGKTALIEALQMPGVKAMPEAGRAIIQQQLAIGGNALPWGDRELFAELMLSWEMRSYAEAQQTEGTVLFDRGVPDVVGYRRLCGLAVPAHCQAAAEKLRYNGRVFVAPPWKEIFTQDRERKQTFEEAERTYQMLTETYLDLGYELVTLPFAPVSDRVHFVIETIGR